MAKIKSMHQICFEEDIEGKNKKEKLQELRRIAKELKKRFPNTKIVLEMI